MAWVPLVMETWNMFQLRVEFLARAAALSPAYLFRGQANAEWELKPSLPRFLAGDSAELVLSVEAQALSLFMREAPMRANRDANVVLPGPTLAPLEWWPLMQHYGAPTRVLDWTTNPYVAAYFAVEREPERDAVISYFAPVHLHDYNKRIHPDFRLNDMQQLYQPDAPHILIAYPGAETSSSRMVGQQGHVTFCANVLGHHGQLIDQALYEVRSQTPLYANLVIPWQRKKVFLRNLIAMNIHAASLFPDLAGLGRSIAEKIELH